MAIEVRKIRLPLEAFLEADLEVVDDATGYTVTARRRRVVVFGEAAGGELASVDLPDATVAAGERFVEAARGMSTEIIGSLTKAGR